MATAKKKSATKRESITFKYEISPNYTTYAITGAYGGPNPHGDIVINLFSEQQPVPLEETYKITEDGTLGEVIKSEKNNDLVVRNVMFAISVKPSVARAIADWIIDKVEQIEKASKVKK